MIKYSNSLKTYLEKNDSKIIKKGIIENGQ